jgi:signal transduction histidine kinase
MAQEQHEKMNLLIRQQVALHTASAIAHELNQPLIAVTAFGEAALNMLENGTGNPEKLTRALSGAIEQSQRAGKVLHELLSHLYKGKEEEAKLTDLNALIRGICAAILTGGGHREFNVVLDLAPARLLVQAQELQLQRVLENLIYNSIDATSDAKGDAAKPATAARITVRSQVVGEMAQVSVEDHGPGVSPATAPYVFQPFFTTKPEGIGLGLSISRALVKAQGGELWLDQTVTQGAKFVFNLPLSR